MSSPISSPSSNNTIKGWRHFFQLLVSKSEEGQLIIIELSVLITTVFLVLLFIHGGLRRRFHVGGWLTALMKGVYILTPIIITYIIGLMRNASSSHELFPVWALVLIYVYGGVDSMTASDLRDNEKALTYALHTIPLFFWAGWLGDFFTGGAHYTVPLIVLFLLASWNSKETLQAMFKAGLTKGLPQYIHHIVDYMRQGKYKPTDSKAPTDPVSMKGYKYLVKEGRDKKERTTTTEDIWACDGLNDIGEGLEGIGHGLEKIGERLKDISLSYAMNLLLLRRFSGFILHEKSDPKTREFVRGGLLNSSEPQRVERLFRIIEVELSFVFDFFYTKLSVITARRSIYKLRRLACVPFFLWFGAVTLESHEVNDAHSLYTITYHGRHLEVVLTRIVLYIIAVLELWQIGMYFLSYWKILFLVCHYVKQQKEHSASCPSSCSDDLKEKHSPSPSYSVDIKEKQSASASCSDDLKEKHLPSSSYSVDIKDKHSPSSSYSDDIKEKHFPSSTYTVDIKEKHSPSSSYSDDLKEKHSPSPSCLNKIKEKVMIWSWSIKKLLSGAFFIGFFLKPWQRKLGQYSFLENYNKVPITRSPLSYTLSQFIKVPRVGQKGDSTVILSEDVKKQIVSSLERILWSSSSPREEPLGKNGVKLHDAHKWGQKLHGATAAEIILVWHIATSVSACCESYSKPKDLKNFTVATQISKYCAYLVTFAPELLPDHAYTTELVFDKAVQDANDLFENKNLKQRCERLLDELVTIPDDRGVVAKGAEVARQMKQHFELNPNEVWKDLAEFWVELLLYITPSEDNATAHGVHLARGGEFITHLWALLTHAGIVTRQDFPPDKDVDVINNNDIP